MPAKIRLQRRGKRGKPFYQIVVADGRAPRDGKFIEKIGTYNPITTPAEIDLNLDRAVYWLQTGAQPTDTVRSILSFKGAIYKNHLLNGVKKGAFSEEQVEIKFQAWLTDKQEKISSKIKDSVLAEKEELRKRLEAEQKINEARAKAIAKKREAESVKREAGAEEPVAEAEVAEEPKAVVETEAKAEAEEPAAEEEKAEEPKAEAEPEAKAEVEEPAAEEEKAEEPKAEAKPEETEAAEEKTEETEEEEKK